MTKWNSKNIEPEDGQWCVFIAYSHPMAGEYRANNKEFYMPEYGYWPLDLWFPFDLPGEVKQ